MADLEDLDFDEDKLLLSDDDDDQGPQKSSGLVNEPKINFSTPVRTPVVVDEIEEEQLDYEEDAAYDELPPEPQLVDPVPVHHAPQPILDRRPSSNEIVFADESGQFPPSTPTKHPDDEIGQDDELSSSRGRFIQERLDLHEASSSPSTRPRGIPEKLELNEEQQQELTNFEQRSTRGRRGGYRGGYNGRGRGGYNRYPPPQQKIWINPQFQGSVVPQPHIRLMHPPPIYQPQAGFGAAAQYDPRQPYPQPQGFYQPQPAYMQQPAPPQRPGLLPHPEGFPQPQIGPQFQPQQFPQQQMFQPPPQQPQPQLPQQPHQQRPLMAQNNQSAPPPLMGMDLPQPRPGFTTLIIEAPNQRATAAAPRRNSDFKERNWRLFHDSRSRTPDRHVVHMRGRSRTPPPRRRRSSSRSRRRPIMDDLEQRADQHSRLKPPPGQSRSPLPSPRPIIDDAKAKKLASEMGLGDDYLKEIDKQRIAREQIKAQKAAKRKLGDTTDHKPTAKGRENFSVTASSHSATTGRTVVAPQSTRVVKPPAKSQNPPQQPVKRPVVFSAGLIEHAKNVRLLGAATEVQTSGRATLSGTQHDSLNSTRSVVASSKSKDNVQIVGRVQASRPPTNIAVKHAQSDSSNRQAALTIGERMKQEVSKHLTGKSRGNVVPAAPAKAAATAVSSPKKRQALRPKRQAQPKRQVVPLRQEKTTRSVIPPTKSTSPKKSVVPATTGAAPATEQGVKRKRGIKKEVLGPDAKKNPNPAPTSANHKGPRVVLIRGVTERLSVTSISNWCALVGPVESVSINSLTSPSVAVATFKHSEHAADFAKTYRKAKIQKVEVTVELKSTGRDFW